MPHFKRPSTGQDASSTLLSLRSTATILLDCLTISRRRTLLCGLLVRCKTFPFPTLYHSIYLILSSLWYVAYTLRYLTPYPRDSLRMVYFLKLVCAARPFIQTNLFAKSYKTSCVRVDDHEYQSGRIVCNSWRVRFGGTRGEGVYAF